MKHTLQSCLPYPKIISSKLSFSLLEKELIIFKVKNPLIITDEFLFPYVRKKLALPSPDKRLGKMDELVYCFPDKKYINDEEVNNLCNTFYAHHCDSIIAIGHSIELNLSRLVRLSIQNKLPGNEFSTYIPLLCIPTANVNGLEFTNISLAKRTITKSDLLYPDILILDKHILSKASLSDLKRLSIISLANIIDTLFFKEPNQFAISFALEALSIINKIYGGSINKKSFLFVRSAIEASGALSNNNMGPLLLTSVVFSHNTGITLEHACSLILQNKLLLSEKKDYLFASDRNNFNDELENKLDMLITKITGPILKRKEYLSFYDAQVEAIAKSVYDFSKGMISINVALKVLSPIPRKDPITL